MAYPKNGYRRKLIDSINQREAKCWLKREALWNEIEKWVWDISECIEMNQAQTITS